MSPSPTYRRERRVLQLLLAFLIALVLPAALLGAAASPAHHAHHTWRVLAGNQSHDLAIQGMSYLPKNIWIDAGDTVHWTANSAEPHTVTFLAAGQSLASTQPFDPSNPRETKVVGGSWYDGHSYYNSGVLTTETQFGFGITPVHSYSLRFPHRGTFTYWCLLHGAAMKGVVHVQRAGAHYPYTQRQYDQQGARTAAWILRDGYHLWHETAELATNHKVLEGNDDGIAMVMRFIRPTVHVHVGQSVTFANIGMGAPHTVTFGTEPANPFPPSGDPKHYAGGNLNSGIQPPGATFTVTFTKEGTFSYICALHDYMGMKGKVVVED
jgi:plastocyanin